MAFDYDFAVRFLLVLLAVIILAVLILQYRKRYAKASVKKSGTESFSMHRDKEKKKKMHQNIKEKYEDSKVTHESDDDDSSSIKVHQPVKASSSPKTCEHVNEKDAVENEAEYDVNPIENANNDDYKAIDFESSKNEDCFPKERLTTEDLLPKDAANSVWAENNPAGQGDVKDQNFLQAGVHFGVDTVGQSLRNANMQLRSDPPIPKVDGLSPWMNTTIEYDTNRRFLEIGS